MNLVLKLERFTAMLLTVTRPSARLDRTDGCSHLFGEPVAYPAFKEHYGQLWKVTGLTSCCPRFREQRLTIRTDPSLVKLLPIGPEHHALEPPFAHLNQIRAPRCERLFDAGDPPTIDLDGALSDHPARLRRRAHEPGLLEDEPQRPRSPCRRQHPSRDRVPVGGQAGGLDFVGQIAVLVDAR